MFLYRYLFDKKLRPFLFPGAKQILKHHAMGYALIVFGFLVVLWMFAAAYFHMRKPGNSYLIYLHLALGFVNIYTVIRSIRSHIRMRRDLRWMFQFAEAHKQAEMKFEKALDESIRNMKYEKNKRSKRYPDLQS